MLTVYNRITRLALNLANPHAHGSGDAPASRVWPYVRSHLRPLRLVLVPSVFITVITASIEVWLIAFVGQLIDMSAETPPPRSGNSTRSA